MGFKTKEEKNAYHRDYYQRLKSGELLARGTKPVKDILGQKFNHLTAIKFSHREGFLQRPYWEFLCECGATKTLPAADVVSGKQKTCGCRTNCLKRVRTSVPEEEARHNKFAMYRYDASLRDLEWSITEELFNALSLSNCCICGVEPKQKHTLKRNNGEDCCLYNGIDRIDNSKGYTTDNVQTCCKRCNFAKHAMSVEEFHEWLDRLVDFQNRERDAKCIGGN